MITVYPSSVREAAAVLGRVAAHQLSERAAGALRRGAGVLDRLATAAVPPSSPPGYGQGRIPRPRGVQ